MKQNCNDFHSKTCIMKKILLLFSLIYSGTLLASNNFNLSYDDVGTGFNDPTDITTLLSNGDITQEQFDYHNGLGNTTLGSIRRATAEQVMEYIESVLDMGTTVLDVQFLTSEFDGTGSIGAANAGNVNISGVLHPYAFQHILTGTDPNTSEPDIRMYIDFGYPINSDYSIEDANSADLFSIILHESTHDLGIRSTIPISASPSVYNENGPHNLWDHLLKVKVATNQYEDVIVSGALNTNAKITTSYQNTIYFYSPGLSRYFDVTSSDPMKPGTSYSHFDDFQRGYEFLMSPAGGVNTILRGWNDIELIALCALGYSMQGNSSTYPFACNLPPVGIEDNYTYTANNWQSLDVLANDIFPSGNGKSFDNTFETNGILVYNNVDVGDFRWINNTLQYFPDPDFCGPVTLSYRPKDMTTGRVGMETFVYINVPCTVCPFNPCSFICNGDMENGIALPQFDQLAGLKDFSGITPPNGSPVDFWWESSSTLDLMVRDTRRSAVAVNVNGSPNTYSNDPNNNRYLRAAAPHPPSPVTYESPVTQTLALNANDQYELSFKAFMKYNQSLPSGTFDHIVEVCISSDYHFFPSGLPDYDALIASGDLTLLQAFTINRTQINQWVDLSTTFTGYGGQQYIYFMTKSPANHLGYTIETHAMYDAVTLYEVGPQLVVTITPDNLTPGVGGTVQYTIEVSNQGSVDATNVRIRNSLPVEYDVSSITSDFNSVSGGVYEHEFASIPVGTSATVHISGTLLNSASLCEPIENVVEILSATPSIGCNKFMYSSWVTVFDPCICDPDCDECLTESNGLNQYQKRYYHDSLGLTPRSSQVFDDRIYSVSEVLDEHKFLITVHDLEGNLINSWSYEHPEEHMQVKDLWVGTEGIFVLGNVTPHIAHGFSSYLINGFISRFDLNGSLVFFRTEKSIYNTYNAFAPTFDGPLMDGFIITGAIYDRASPGVGDVMIAGVNLLGDPQFMKSLKFNIPCANCLDNIEATMGYDITEIIDATNYPRYGILVVTRDNTSTGISNGDPDGFTFINVDRNGGIAYQSLSPTIWTSTLGDAVPNRILGHFDPMIGHPEFFITGFDAVLGNGFLLATDDNYLTRLTNQYDETSFFIDAQIVNGELVIHNDRSWFRTDLNGTVINSGDRLNYDRLLNDYGFTFFSTRCNRGHLMHVLDNDQGIGLDIRELGIKLYAMDNMYQTTCTDPIAVPVPLSWTLTNTGLNEYDQITYTPAPEDVLLCPNPVPLADQCCISEQASDPKWPACDYYFSFDIDLNFTDFTITGLDNPESNAWVTISNSSGVVVSEAYDPLKMYLMSEVGDDYTICITQTNSDNCTYTFCKCAFIGCPPTEYETRVIEDDNGYWFMPTQEPGYEYYLLTSTNPDPGYTYDSRDGYTNPDGSIDYWIMHILLPQDNYYYKIYDINGCLLKDLTMVIRNTNTEPHKPENSTKVSNTTTPDQHGEEQVQFASNSQPLNLNLTLVPNPNNGSFILNYSGQNVHYEQVNVLSPLGQTVLTYSHVESSHQFDVSHLTDGVYLVEVQINGESHRLRMIKTTH